MNKIGKFLLFTLFASLCWVACSDDDDPELTALSTPTVENTFASVSSLTFQWDKIAGASQYAYELTSEALAEPKGGVTSGTSVTFTGLKDDTEYTLTVWAYAPALSDTNSASQKVVITMRTPKIMPLDAPTGLEAKQDGANIVITWEAVENAQVYVYSYIKEGSEEPVEGTTENCELSLSGLSIGDYTFTLYADTEAEAFSASPEAQASFSRIRIKEWETQGTYTAATNESWTATVEGYDDGSYIIRAFYGVTGYDLEFVPTSDGLVNIAGGNSGYFYKYTGLSSGNYYCLTLYQGEGYESYTSTFEGGKDAGTLSIYYYNAANEWCADYFTWGATEEEGTWEVTGTYTTSSGTIIENMKLRYNGGGSYTLVNFCGGGDDYTFTPSSDGSTLNFEGATVPGYVNLYNGTAWLTIYDASSDYCSFEGNKDGGTLRLYDYYLGYEYFTWGGASGPTIDDLVGTYMAKSTGQDALGGSWVAFEDEEEVTIEKIDETTVQVNNFYFEGYSLIATVDMEARTLTFQPQSWSYYTFCYYDAPTTSVVATFDENFTITMSNWTAYYASYSTSYVYYSSSTLTKQ